MVFPKKGTKKPWHVSHQTNPSRNGDPQFYDWGDVGLGRQVIETNLAHYLTPPWTPSSPSLPRIHTWDVMPRLSFVPAKPHTPPLPRSGRRCKARPRLLRATCRLKKKRRGGNGGCTAQDAGCDAELTICGGEPQGNQKGGAWCSGRAGSHSGRVADRKGLRCQWRVVSASKHASLTTTPSLLTPGCPCFPCTAQT